MAACGASLVEEGETPAPSEQAQGPQQLPPSHAALMPVRRPCLEHRCRSMAVEGGSRCQEHQQQKNREHYENVSPGTTSRWGKQVARVKRRDKYRCRHCGKPERKVNARSNLQVHHVNGGGIRSNAPDDRLMTLCTKCHRIAEQKLRDYAADRGELRRAR